ncbi:MAG: hypothetical protein IEMM0008_0414 [bacterium]|nr:MAG: hypothetical protein IEMM0008_0414 [bacterium]
MMEINEALDHISEIHRHLNKTEVYRGIGSFPVALSGLITFVAGYLQPFFVSEGDPITFVVYWSGLALINLTIAFGVIGYNYFFRESPLDRKRTRTTIGQFLPSVLVGLIITFFLTLHIDTAGLHYESSDIDTTLFYLPGIWAALFGLGILSSRPYLPKHFIWVALYFLIGGIHLFFMAEDRSSLAPWGMAVTFGFGLLLISGVFYWSNERPNND